MTAAQLICDFVNTADLEEGTDELRAWLGGPRGLASAIAVREAVRELLRGNNGVEVDIGAASATLDAAARDAGLSVQFEHGAARLVGDGALGSVLAAVAQAMADGSWSRIKACRSDTCRWAFVDNARNHSRQWCDMAVCGNRAKARTFRERHA
jgi:predicted RNA-binding Zn ribbon-like protein